VGTIELAVPKLREGSYFPDWLLQPRRRAEQAFVSVIADAYLAGVSTRRVEKLVQQLGVERMSKSQVSRLAKSLDQVVADFRTRPLGRAPYPYLVLDALEVKCRERGRTVNVCVVHAVAVNRDGVRESLGLAVVTSEDGAAWLAFLRSLVARGLAGVKLVTSDAHPGLVDAIAATLPGASWQRCRTHFMRNLLTRVPKSAQSFVATMVRTIFAQPDAESAREQHRRIIGQLETRFPEAAALLEEAGPEILAFTAQPSPKPKPKEPTFKLRGAPDSPERCAQAAELVGDPMLVQRAAYDRVAGELRNAALAVQRAEERGECDQATFDAFAAAARHLAAVGDPNLYEAFRQEIEVDYGTLRSAAAGYRHATLQLRLPSTASTRIFGLRKLYAATLMSFRPSPESLKSPPSSITGSCREPRISHRLFPV
jgi:hypothetical protein